MPTLPKIFRPVTRNTHIILFGHITSELVQKKNESSINYCIKTGFKVRSVKKELPKQIHSMWFLKPLFNIQLSMPQPNRSKLSL